MAGQVVADATGMASDHALFRFRDPGGHMRADGEDMAQQARLSPLGDVLEAIVVAEHIAHLDDQLTLLGLVEALVVAAFRGDRHNPSIIEQLTRIVEPAYARVWSAGALQLPAPRQVGLKDARKLHARVAPKRLELAGGVAVFGTILSNMKSCHR